MMGDNFMGRIVPAHNQAKSQETLIFLHGLLNAGRTWRQFVLNDDISQDRDVLLLDLRNHGESDHHSSMTYTELAEDIARYIDSKGIE